MRRWLLACGLLVTALAGAVYWYSAEIIRHVAIELAAERGVLLDTLELERPGFDGIRVHRAAATIGAARMRATQIDIGYRPGSISSAPWGEVAIQHLHVELGPGVSGEAGPHERGSTAGGVDPARIFGIVPLLTVTELSVRQESLGFAAVGEAVLDADSLRLQMSAVAPETARNLELDGRLHADRTLVLSVTDSGQPDPPLLRAEAALSAQGAAAATGEFAIGGDRLQQFMDLFSLPAGAGTVRGSARLTFGSLALSELSVLADVAVDWENELLRLEGLQGEFECSADCLGAGALLTRTGEIVLPAANARFILGSGTALHYADDQIALGPGVSAVVRALEDVELDVAVRQAGIDLRGPGAIVSGRAGLDVSAYGLSGDGAIDCDLDVTSESVVAECGLSAGGFDVPLRVAYDLDRGRGSFSSAGRMDADGVFARLVDNWPYDVEIENGVLDYALSGEVLDGAARGQAKVQLDHAAVRYADYGFADVSADLAFEFDEAGLLMKPSPVRVGLFDFGTAIEDAEFVVGWQADVVDLDEGRFSVLGGMASITPTRFDLAQRRGRLEITLTELDLSQVLALEGDDITGTGRLYGALPLEVDGGLVSMADGRVHAGEDGGVIRIAPEFDLATGQPGIDFALEALADFKFETLEAVANYAQNGDLELAVSLQGRNPEVEKGRPIHYNLNISENVFALIKALSAQRGITDHVERRVLDKQGS